MSDFNITDEFLGEIFDLSLVEITDDIEHEVKRTLLDYVAVTLAGAKIFKNRFNENYSKINDNSSYSSSIIGYKKKATLENAIFLNGILSHIAELDDGVRFGGIHPGGPIFSCLLPVAEQLNIKKDNFVKGVVTGYETAVRLANAIHPGHYKKGFHPTSTCGSIGASVGLAVMLGYNQKQIKTIFSASVVSAAGTLKILEDASDIKPFNVGRASVDGYLATQLGRFRFQGPDNVLGGASGFFSMFCDEVDQKHLLKGSTNLDESAIKQIYVKPYAACRHAHAAIEATKFLREENNIDHRNVSKIDVYTYNTIIGKHDHHIIRGVTSAKMSIPYSIAVTLVTGEAGISEFTEEKIKDPAINELLLKINVIADPEFSKMVLLKRPAKVRIYCDDKVFEKQVDFPKGEPETRLSDRELSEKFHNLSYFYGLSDSNSAEIESLIWNLDNNFLEIFKFL